MTDKFIQLKQDDSLVFEIKDADGNSTGEYLTFQVNDVELPLRYQELVEKNKKNKEWLRNQTLIIEKRQDVKGKKMLSKNEEDLYKALDEYYKRQTEVYNMFLGERGVEKLLNGQKMGWDSLHVIDEYIETYIAPYFKDSFTNLKQKIVDLYSDSKENDTIK